MVDTPFRILGVDPGLSRTGYGIIEIISNKARHVDYGVIASSSSKKLPDRLNGIYKRICAVISEHHPHVLAIEEIFFANNPKSTLKLGQARATAILAGVHQDLEIYEYSALKVKKSITSYGRATKEQVQSMVKILLGMNEIPRYDDSSDALAIALCHFHSMKYQALTQSS